MFYLCSPFFYLFATMQLVAFYKIGISGQIYVKINIMQLFALGNCLIIVNM